MATPGLVSAGSGLATTPWEDHPRASGGVRHLGGRRAAWVSAAVVVAAVAVIVAAAATTRGSASPDGGPVATAQAFGLPPVVPGAAPAALGAAPGHPVILTFFAAWCAPCTQELPLFATLPVGHSGAQVVGVDVMDQRPDATALLAATGVTFPAGFDHDGTVANRWGVQGLPVTVMVAPDGRVVAYHRGQLGRAALDVLVARLVKASS